MRFWLASQLRFLCRRELYARIATGRHLPVAIITIPLVLLFTSDAVSKGGTPVARKDPKKVQGLVNDLRERLAIPEEVTVTVVDANALLVSVELPRDGRSAFRLAFEADFLDQLDDDELRAVVAHELGHVWIYTHHPYLQTERLANQIAMRVVSRESLQKVYGKVWERAGTKGNLAGFLGEQ
jgi:hypothetical protein